MWTEGCWAQVKQKTEQIRRDVHKNQRFSRKKQVKQKGVESYRPQTTKDCNDFPVMICFVPCMDKQHQPKYIAFYSIEEKCNFKSHS